MLFATVAGEGGGAAAALRWDGETILARLIEQFTWLGVRDIRVVTRPALADELAPSLAGHRVPVRLVVSPGVPDDFRAVAEVARTAAGPLVLGLAEIVTRDQGVAGLLTDPRVSTGILATAAGFGRPFTFPTRTSRGRIVSAASPYHWVKRGNHRFLGMLRVAPAQQDVLVEVAERLAQLTAPPLLPAWEDHFEAKTGRWRKRLSTFWRYRIPEDEEILTDDPEADEEDEDAEEADDSEEQEPVRLTGEAEEELRLRVAAAKEDVTALLLVGLVRSSVHVGSAYVRKFYWGRPLSHAEIERVRKRMEYHDEGKALLDSVVKPVDGFFTTFFVSPYSKYIARWAATRGFTPNQVTTASLLIGVLAAAAFATGERAGLIAGAVLLQMAFTTDCVDGQLARYTRTFSRLGAWLDSMFDRAKEYVVFAGLAIGASQAGDPVWVLACAALTLQTFRHTTDMSFAASAHQAIGTAMQQPLENPSDRPPRPPRPRPDRQASAPEPMRRRPPLARRMLRSWRRVDRLPGALWVKRMVAFPIGERFATISITAAIWDARVTFVVLLAWGGFATVYSSFGRVLRSIR